MPPELRYGIRCAVRGIEQVLVGARRGRQQIAGGLVRRGSDRLQQLRCSAAAKEMAEIDLRGIRWPAKCQTNLIGNGVKMVGRDLGSDCRILAKIQDSLPRIWVVDRKVAVAPRDQ